MLLQLVCAISLLCAAVSVQGQGTAQYAICPINSNGGDWLCQVPGQVMLASPTCLACTSQRRQVCLLYIHSAHVCQWP